MLESDFWPRLEYRVCWELDGIRSMAERGYWCDGFIPSWYDLDGPIPNVSGIVWMGRGPRNMEEWEFALLLGLPFDSVEAIDWSLLLPPEDVTRWLTAEPARKRLILEPGVAVPDREATRRLTDRSRPDP